FGTHAGCSAQHFEATLAKPLLTIALRRHVTAGRKVAGYRCWGTLPVKEVVRKGSRKSRLQSPLQQLKIVPGVELQRQTSFGPAHFEPLSHSLHIGDQHVVLRICFCRLKKDRLHRLKIAPTKGAHSQIVERKTRAWIAERKRTSRAGVRFL